MKIRPSALLPLAAILELAVLALDLTLPAAYTEDAAYVAIMVFAFWMPRRAEIWFLALLGTVFMTVGNFFPAEAFAWDELRTLSNRAMGYAGIWLVAIMAVKHQASVAELQRAKATLREAERIAPLGRFEMAGADDAQWSVSDEMLRILGVADDGQPNRAQSVDIDRLVHPNDRDALRSGLLAAAGRAEPVEVEFRVVRPDGAIRYLHGTVEAGRGARGRPLEGTVIDVTEHKLTEQALSAREARLQSILETAPEGIITIDEKGIIDSFSASAETLFGYKATEAVGRNVRMLMPSPDCEHHDQYINRYLTTGERRIIGIGRVVTGQRRDGTQFPMELAVGEVASGGERIFTGFIRDLTARQRMEQELRQAQRMEAVGQLTGGIAHDFNNLLTVIMGNLEMLQSRIDMEGRPGVWLKEAYETAQLGADLTRRLLAFARRQPLHPRVIDLGQLVQQSSDLLRRTLGESIEVRTQIGRNLYRPSVDPGQLENALLNLAINARDAMPNGGTVTIDISNAVIDSHDAQLQLELRQGRYVMISVTDSGTGMSAEVRDRAFEPFFTTKPVGAGTGLGLSMVYGFVKQSGGHVQIYSELGKGTTIRMYLPRAPESDVTAPQPAEVSSGSFPAKGERVLVVEDDPRVRRITVDRLNALGYGVVEAENGLAALEKLGSGENIDLLFTDMVMPGGMSGSGLAEVARQRVPGLKVLFTSGYAAPEVIRKGAIKGSDWLGKPYTALDMARKLREVLDS